MRKEDHKKCQNSTKEKSEWETTEIGIKNNPKTIKSMFKKATNNSATIQQRYWSATMKTCQN